MGAALHEMTHSAGRWIRMTVLAVVLGGLVGPILAGLWHTTLAAFGGLQGPAGAANWHKPWRELAALPGLAHSVALSLWIGLAATGLSLGLAFGLVALWHRHGMGARGLQLLTPLLAAPHSAMAVGLVFLIAPSGWIARLISPWATGWTLPPDLGTVNDPLGLALILGLVAKELPFLLLVTVAALGQIPVGHQFAAGQSMGYGRGQVWLLILLPAIYRLIRLPVYVVLAFSLSVVDMAIILGPSNPPTLAVAMTRWFTSADLALFAPASAAALLQAALVVLAAVIWASGLAGLGWLGKWLIRRGVRRAIPGVGPLVQSAGLLLLAIGGLALLSSLIWSVTQRWSFPNALPESWTMAAWMQAGAGWQAAMQTTAIVGASASALSLLLAILWLEGETRGNFSRAAWAEGLIYLPLLVPQVAFLFGLHIVFLRLGIGGDLRTVIWVHTIFVFPYVMLALSDPWRALDPRLMRTAAALGASPLRQLLMVRLPCLTGPVLTAVAIGFAVSVAQYLPTLFLGAGRVATLTTEAVSLSSGGNRRISGVFAVLQSLLPLLAYGLAVLVPALLFRNRRGLRGGAD